MSFGPNMPGNRKSTSKHVNLGTFQPHSWGRVVFAGSQDGGFGSLPIITQCAFQRLVSALLLQYVSRQQSFSRFPVFCDWLILVLRIERILGAKSFAPRGHALRMGGALRQRSVARKRAAERSKGGPPDLRLLIRAVQSSKLATDLPLEEFGRAIIQYLTRKRRHHMEVEFTPCLQRKGGQSRLGSMPSGICLRSAGLYLFKPHNPEKAVRWR